MCSLSLRGRHRDKPLYFYGRMLIGVPFFTME